MKKSIFCLALLSSLCVGANAFGGWTQWSGNDHWYKVISAPNGISWTDAQAASVALGGTLATVTSQGENDFVFGLVNDDHWESSNGLKWLGPWMGGYKGPNGTWHWVTGETWSYSDWGNDQPDNSGGNETKLNWWYSGTAANPSGYYAWNDFPDEVSSASFGRVRAYIVERNTPVPEPASMTAMVLGALGLIKRRKK
jgi:hypothetical protein